MYASCCDRLHTSFKPVLQYEDVTKHPDLVTSNIVKTTLDVSVLVTTASASTCGSFTYLAGNSQVEMSKQTFFTVLYNWKDDPPTTARVHQCTIRRDDCVTLYSSYLKDLSSYWKTYATERLRATQSIYEPPKPVCQLGENKCDQCTINAQGIHMYYSQPLASRDMCASEPVPLTTTDRDLSRTTH